MIISTKVWEKAGIKLATLDLHSDSHLVPDMLPSYLADGMGEGIIRAVTGQHSLSEHCYKDMINVTTIACTLTINFSDVYTKQTFGKDYFG